MNTKREHGFGQRVAPLVIGTLLAVSMLAVLPANATSYDDVIGQRQHAFKTIDKQIDQLERQLDADNLDWQRIRQLAGNNQKLSEALFSQFPKGSTDGSRAKEKVWTEWTKFEGLMKQMEQGFAELYLATNTGQLVEANRGLKQAKDSCRSCHRAFRSFW